MSKEILDLTNPNDDFDHERLYSSWYEEARNTKLSTLMIFIRGLLDGYKHSYESYVHAVTACAIAAANASDSELSAFQASFVAVLFPKQYFYWHNKCGISLRNWDNMLYPEYEHSFKKIIPASTWKAMQEEAKHLYEENEKTNGCAPHDLKAHWKSIIDGKVPFNYEVEKDE